MRKFFAALYSDFYLGLGFRLAEWVTGRDTFHLLEELAEFDRAGAEDRNQRLEGLLSNALEDAASVEHYRECINTIPADMIASDPYRAILKVPVVCKDELRRGPERFVNLGAKGSARSFQTAGSTGRPMQAYSDPHLSAMTKAGMIYGRSWWGVKPGARSVSIWGHSKYLLSDWRSRVRLKIRRTLDFLVNRRVFPAYDLSPVKLNECIQLLNSFGPEYIVGYSSALWKVARTILDSSECVPPVKAIVVTGEMLYPEQERLIIEAFNAPVVREYGLAEGGVVAYQCPAGRFHVMDSHVYLELLDEEDSPVEPGQTGRIVISLLRCGKVPLLRYDTGDLAEEVRQDCSCGRSSRQFGTLLGRAYDLLITKDGTAVSGVLITHALKYLEEIDQYQVVQFKPGALEVRYVADSPLSGNSERDAIAKITEQLPGLFEIDFHRLDVLEREQSGKFRLIRSEVV